MEIVYTSHLEFRLKIRNLPYDLPRAIFQQSKEHYYDNLTKHYVAVHKVEFEGETREMALTYDRGKKAVQIVTLHPLKTYQKQSRLNSGRWRKI